MNLRRRNDTTETPAPDEGAAVTTAITPRSQESVNRVLAALRDSDTAAKDRDEKSRNALADAERLDQAVAGLNQRESEIRAELDKIQHDREAAAQRARQARDYAKRMTAERDEFNAQADDSKDILASWGVTLDPDLLVPTSNGVDTTTADARIEGALARLNAAHDELPQEPEL